MEPFGSVGGDPLVSLISGCVDISCRRSIKRPCADPNARAASHSVTQKGYTLCIDGTNMIGHRSALPPFLHPVLYVSEIHCDDREGLVMIE
jgi:hypothetical protein